MLSQGLWSKVLFGSAASCSYLFGAVECVCERESASRRCATELNGSKIFLALEAFANECRKSLHLVRGEARRRADGGRELAEEAMLIPR
jgi:hypothetical protein